jgi:predicted nuclease of predicted toxin-antitoxin system
MKVLFDHGVPVPLRRHFPEHSVAVAFEQGWATLKNGDLISAAIASGFDVLLTTDKNLSHQQNLADVKIAVVVLPTTSWPKLRTMLPQIAKAISESKSGAVQMVRSS